MRDSLLRHVVDLHYTFPYKLITLYDEEALGHVSSDLVLVIVAGDLEDQVRYARAGCVTQHICGN